MHHAMIKGGAALCVAGLLSGCGNDPDRSHVAGVLPGLLSTVAGTDGAEGTTTGLPAPETVLSNTDAAVILSQSEKLAEPFYLIELRQNGPYRTYATANRQTLTLRDGVVTATRGFGNDLMASDVAQTLTALQGTGTQIVTRRMQFLDGEDVTRELHLSCTIAPAPSPASGLRGMTETCKNAEFSFVNDYTFSSDGMIRRSTQWISPGNGRLVLAVLRD